MLHVVSGYFLDAIFDDIAPMLSLDAIRLHRFVMRQHVFLRLAIHYLNVVLSEANDVDPVTSGVDNLNLCGSSLRAAHDRHRHQAYG